MPPSRRPCCSLPAGPIWRRRQLTRLLPSTTKLRQRLQWQLTKLTLRCCLLLPRLLLLPWKLKTLVRYSPHDEVSLKLCGPYEIIFSGCVHVCKLPGVNGVIQITSSAICAWSDHRCETLTQFLKPAAINPRLVAFTYVRKSARSPSNQAIIMVNDDAATLTKDFIIFTLVWHRKPKWLTFWKCRSRRTRVIVKTLR